MSMLGIGRRGQSGYSLTELVVIMAAGMVIVSAAIPLTTSVSAGYRLVLAGQAVASQLHYARMKAVASNEELRVAFPAGQTFYRVESGTGAVIAGPFWLPRCVSWDAGCGNSITFPGNYVSFQPTGELPASGSGSAGRVKRLNASGRKIDLVVTRGGIIRQTPAYSGCTPPF